MVPIVEKMKSGKKEKKNKNNKNSKNSSEEGPVPVRFRKDRHTGIVGGILYFVFVVALSALLAGVGWLAATDVLALGKTEEAVEVTIPDEYDADTIADTSSTRGSLSTRACSNSTAGFLPHLSMRRCSPAPTGFIRTSTTEQS
jgi:hypothetical protein